MSEEEKRVLDCVKKWLQIKATEMEKRGEDPTKYNLYQLPADIDHSWLLERLLKGKRPESEPPDRRSE